MFRAGSKTIADCGGRTRLLLLGVPLCLLLTAALALTPGRALAGQYSSCQPYQARACLFPFPDNRLTVASKHTLTGRRVALPAKALPVGDIPGGHVHISPGPFDQSDGFSPGTAILLHIPQLDTPAALKRTNPVGLLNMAAYKRKRAPIVVLDEQTGKRVMVYSELDSTATTAAARNLMILPGAEWLAGHTYLVVLRDLKSASGHMIGAPGWFAKLRAGKTLPQRERAQAARYQRIFRILHKAGIERNHALYAAWDFTVASRANLTAPLLRIRDAAFRTLGDKDLADGRVQGRAPSYTITSNTEQGGSSGVRDVIGTFRVPCFLDQCGAWARAGFHYSSHKFGSLPTQNGMTTARFECVIPDSASPLDPTRISLYGHGLLGDMSEVTDGAITSLAVGQHITLCATNWWGLAAPDYNYDIKVVGDVNQFPNFVARLQQGVLNTLFLGRLMRNSSGLASNAAFQSSGSPLINTSQLFYDGNSQGGIFGGLTTAVSPDVRRATLGVTGVDYANVLVQRSTDFGTFGQLLDQVYANHNQSAYTAILDLLDQQWDRADPVSYVQGLSDRPLPNTPTHQVLMQIAYGDHQVSMYSGAAEAREIGARAYLPNGTGLAADRNINRHLFYGLKPAPLNGKYTGSVVEIWDDGPIHVANPPVGNLPPTRGHDPHGDPRATALAQTQIGDFLKPNGTFANVCGGQPCVSTYQP